jgi:hypothetical protein
VLALAHLGQAVPPMRANVWALDSATRAVRAIDAVFAVFALYVVDRTSAGLLDEG